MSAKTALLWFKIGAIFQLLTALIHSLSFFSEAQPRNDEERQLLQLMREVKMDFGVGFIRNMEQIMTSLSVTFSLLLLFSGAVNLVLAYSGMDLKLWNRILSINILIYAIGLFAMLKFAFIAPVVCLGIILASFFICRIFLFKAIKSLS